MRPKFQSDTCYIPFQEGIYLRNNHGGLMLKGKSLYGLLQHLIPVLDGGATIEEITDGLNADQKQMIVGLLEKLSAHHFLSDVEQDRALSVSRSELDMYASDLAFITSFQGNATRSLLHFLDQRLLIIGSGLCLSSLVEAGLQRGIKQIGVGIEASQTAPDIQCYYMPSGHVPEQSIRELAALPWDNELALQHIIQDYDAVLYASDRPVLERAQLLNRLCWQQQRALLQALVIDNHAWIGPLVHPATKGCWECAWRRLQSNLVPLAERLPHYTIEAPALDPTDQPYVTRAAAAVIAQRLLFELFCYFTRSGDPQTCDQLIELDLTSFQSSRHAFLPHPLCQSCQQPVAPTAAQFLERLRSRQSHPAMDAETFFDSLAPCTDKLLGLFTIADAEDFVQLPLTVFQVRVSNPLLLARQHEPLMITAADVDATAAGLRASQAACEHYLAEIVDRRRLLTSTQAHQQRGPMIAPDHFIHPSSPSPVDELWSWAFSLHDAQPCLVPASQVFYALHHHTEEALMHPPGVASGMSWNETLCHALSAWCQYLTVDRLASSPQPYPQVDLAATALTDEGMHLAQILKIACGQFTIYDVTGPLRVPTFALCIDGRVIAYGTHCDVLQALQIAMRQALQYYQSMRFQQPAYSVAPPVDLPPTLRGEQLVVPGSPCSTEETDQLAWLVRTLRSHQINALVVPLDHDPALAEAFPFVVRILLSRIEV